MPMIGLFRRTPDGFTGKLETLTVEVAITLLPNDAGDAENAPDFRVHLGAEGHGPEVGAGWRRTGEKAGAYLSLIIDNPCFATPIHANRFQSGDDGDTHHLVWTRQARRDARG